jgi:hypothetical protein
VTSNPADAEEAAVSATVCRTAGRPTAGPGARRVPCIREQRSPPPLYLRDFAASLAEAIAPAVGAKRGRKLLAAERITETSVTTKPSSGSTTSMLPRSKDALPVPAPSRSIAGSMAVATPAR